MNRIYIICFLLGVFLAAGCRTIEPEKTAPLSLPEQYTDRGFQTGYTEQDTTKDWWSFLESAELDDLIAKALTSNYDLISLRAQIDQEQARLKREKAGFWPNLLYSLGGTKRETKTKRSSSQSSTQDGSHSWDASLTSSYTADIWGEQTAIEQSQAMTLAAAKRDLHTAALALTSEVAETWIDILSVREEIDIIQQQIEINNTLLELQKLRFTNGQATALDVSQQREALAEASSQGPLLEQREQLLLHELSLLLGKNKPGSVMVMEQPMPDPVAVPQLGVPADLLGNRPDIQAAFARLQSSQWDIHEAKADLLPSFTLSGQALFSSGELDLLFSNWVASLTATLAGPIFDAGLRKAEVERTRAALKEEVNDYAKTVAIAIKEVEDLLVRIEKQKEFIQLLEEELRLARLTLKDAMIQYRNGQSSYLNYLTAWTSVERLERQLVGERATYLKDRIAIYSALGWQGTGQWVSENDNG